MRYLQNKIGSFEGLFLEANMDKIKKGIYLMEKASSYLGFKEGIIKVNEGMELISNDITRLTIKHYLNLGDLNAIKQLKKAQAKSLFMISSLSKYEKLIRKCSYHQDLKKDFGNSFVNEILSKNKNEDKGLLLYLREMKYVKKYQRLISNSKVLFNGNLKDKKEVKSYLSSSDLDERREAFNSLTKYHAQNALVYDKLLDKLVRLRDKQSHIHGYKNYMEESYSLFERCYKKDDVLLFRRQILKTVVPFVYSMKKRIGKQLGLSNEYYNNEILLKSNPHIQFSLSRLLKHFGEVLSKLDIEFFNLFQRMQEEGLLKLGNESNKLEAGYTTYLSDVKLPYIHASITGDISGIRILSHEFGHALAFYFSSKNNIFQNIPSSFDIAEIHSMTFEEIIALKMDFLDGNDYKKFQFIHLMNALVLLCFSTMIDAYQHILYEHPTYDYEKRRTEYRRLEKMYMPWVRYNNEMEAGLMLHDISHIYEHPFYGIDYSLSQICAFELRNNLKTDFELGMKKYKCLLPIGKRYSFYEMLKLVNLKNPLEKGNIKEILAPIFEEIEKLYEEISVCE